MTNSIIPSGTNLIFQVEGNSLPQLFENTAREMLKLFVDPNDVGEVLREKVVIEAADTAALFRGWIEALLSLAANQQILFKTFRFQVFDAERVGAGKLRSEVTGELVDPARHVFRNDPKRWKCDQVHLLNNSKTIEAKVIFKFA